MKKNIFAVLLIIVVVFVAVIPALPFALSKNEERTVGDADMVQENNRADDEENAGIALGLEVSQLAAVITPYSNDNDDVSYSRWELTVTRENGDVLTKLYDYGNYYVRDPELFYADLNGDGSDEIVLIMPNATSNYVASNIHVLRVDKDILTEILTILDSPQEYLNDYIDEYKDSLFIIPHTATGEALPPYTPESYETFCTGAEIVQTSEGDELWIRHIMEDSVPYSIIQWNGDGWHVAEQGINLVPSNEDKQTALMKFYDVVLPAPNVGETVNYDSYYQKTEVYNAENVFNPYIDFNGERYLLKLCFERLNDHSNPEVIPKIRLSIFILDEDYNILYETVIKNSDEPETDEFVSGNEYYISLKGLEQTIPNLMSTCMTWYGGHGSYISIAYENDIIIVYEGLSGENQFPIEIMRICINNVQNNNRVQVDSDVLLNFTDENLSNKAQSLLRTR